MDEQFVRQLAIRIDSQAAQAVQSHEAQAKGGYLWRTFPQVQSCKNYNEAVLLLAREQVAALKLSQAKGYSRHSPQQMQASQGFGVQPQGLEVPQQVQTGFGTTQQVQEGFGAPPPANIFGTQAVPQAGVPAASKFTAFKPQTEEVQGKVFGFIPSKVFAILIIGIIVAVVVGGVVLSIKNAVTQEQPTINNSPAAVNPDETDDPFADFFE